LNQIKSKLTNDDMEQLLEAVESVYISNQKLKQDNQYVTKLD